MYLNIVICWAIDFVTKCSISFIFSLDGCHTNTLNEWLTEQLRMHINACKSAQPHPADESAEC